MAVLASPFLKWAGGKSQLLDTLVRNAPVEFNCYYEPFLGGGACFFRLRSIGKIRHAVISDANRDLINCYVAVRDNLGALLHKLAFLQQHADDKEFYDDVAKPGFNNIRLKSGLEGDIEKASLLIYLNKTCYNGLYRVNSRSEYNVPWGRYKNPRIYDPEILKSVSAALQGPNIKIKCCDYGKALEEAGEGNFAYLDPPYQPLSSTSIFTQYTPEAFREDDQRRLAGIFKGLDRRGCRVMLSNSYNPLIEGLYSEYLQRGTFEVTMAARQISCKGSGRGQIREYIIRNY